MKYELLASCLLGIFYILIPDTSTFFQVELDVAVMGTRGVYRESYPLEFGGQ